MSNITRKVVDWDSVEPLYRAGILSNYEVAQQYAADHKHSQTWKQTVAESAIRKKAKEKGWEKNLAGRIKERVREKLVRDDVRNANLSDAEIVEQASEEPVLIAKGQRARTAYHLQIQDELSEELRAATDIDIMSRVRGFKDIAAAIRLHHDQQAAQYNLSSTATTNTGSNMIEVEFVGMS